ncbi:MAG: DegT/DnrJ/EryC1/StrS aminotransferase family protein [Deltaproteobacteria bacterium]|nr:DegT/DnrJ/EryC1/StrS aminotransferase family protein [Deltaproteobacteria bacterium]
MASRSIPFHRPAIGENEIRAVVETLRSGWITTGPRVKELEESFAAFVGARHAVAVNSGTAAIHLGLLAAGLGPGEAILTSPITFPATTEAAIYCGAEPLFADVDPVTLNLDPAAVERALERFAATKRVRVLVPVHYGGQPCAMERLVPIARRHGLRIVEDAAHALPAWRRMPVSGSDPVSPPPRGATPPPPGERWRMVGTIGDFTAFSFYATKTITTAEGGMVTCESDAGAELLRSLRLHGLSGDAWQRYRAEGSWRYDVARTGYKDNMPDVLAAIGVEQLKRAGELAAARARLVELYRDALAALADRLVLPGCEERTVHAWHLFPIRMREPARRGPLIEGLKARGIGTGVHFIPVHLHSFYASTYGYRRGDFPVAEAAFDGLVSLPLWPGMSEDDVAYVASSLRELLDRPTPAR